MFWQQSHTSTLNMLWLSPALFQCTLIFLQTCLFHQLFGINHTRGPNKCVTVPTKCLRSSSSLYSKEKRQWFGVRGDFREVEDIMHENGLLLRVWLGWQGTQWQRAGFNFHSKWALVHAIEPCQKKFCCLFLTMSEIEKCLAEPRERAELRASEAKPYPYPLACPQFFKDPSTTLCGILANFWLVFN